jgi:hypothetical protein
VKHPISRRTSALIRLTGLTKAAEPEPSARDR